MPYVPPVDRAEFMEHAKPASFVVQGSECVVPADDFSTGSYGWKYRERIAVTVNGKRVEVIVNINATVVGSKRQ